MARTKYDNEFNVMMIKLLNSVEIGRHCLRQEIKFLKKR